jgi:hypothetical protein
MKTGGIHGVWAHAVEKDEILFTQEDGDIFSLKKFVLEQPEIKKFTWNSQAREECVDDAERAHVVCRISSPLKRRVRRRARRARARRRGRSECSHVAVRYSMRYIL